MKNLFLLLKMIDLQIVAALSKTIPMVKAESVEKNSVYQAFPEFKKGNKSISKTTASKNLQHISSSSRCAFFTFKCKKTYCFGRRENHLWVLRSKLALLNWFSQWIFHQDEIKSIYVFNEVKPLEQSSAEFKKIIDGFNMHSP